MQQQTQSQRPQQQQDRQPGIECEMTPRPKSEEREYRGCGKLEGKAALITGGDSGIGRAVAVAFAKEGADVAIMYLNEHDDANKTKELVEKEGRRCILISGDIGDSGFCESGDVGGEGVVNRLDILVNNAAEKHETERLEDISDDQLLRTFKTNILSQFYWCGTRSNI